MADMSPSVNGLREMHSRMPVQPGSHGTMTRGIIFDIQRYSTHDGPGIRTTVFFKGCSLRCFWCHNPESIRPEPELLFDKAKCIGCGRCAASCPNGAIGADDGRCSPVFPAAGQPTACHACGTCAAVCPPNALSVSGRHVTVREVMAEVEKDTAFYRRSGGGVTASGGEALLQSGFVSALFAACRENEINTVLDTAGNVPFSAFEAVLPYTGLFLYDIKTASPERHRSACGADNRRILDNLRRLSAAGASIRVRIPVIPGFNDDVSSMAEIGEIICRLPHGHGADLLRFHRMGTAKYERLRQPYAAGDITPPSDAVMQALADVLKQYCTDVQI